MLIDEGKPTEALLCITAIDPIPNDDRTYTVNFYPVDSALELVETDGTLTGHLSIDLPDDVTKPNKMTADLQVSIVRRLQTYLKNGLIVALRRQKRRGQYTGKILFGRRNPEHYLPEEALAWLKALEASGYIFWQQAVFLHNLNLWLQNVASIAAKKKPARQPKPKLKRKERRRLERIINE